MFYGFLVSLLLLNEYEYKQDLSTEYYRQYGHFLYFGKLDEYGNFVPAPNPTPVEEPMDISQGWPKGFFKNYAYLMMSNNPKIEAYEFRSNRLIPGIIHNEEFAPDIEGKVIAFSDYKYSKVARRIYNLPGKFVPKKQVEGQQSQENNLLEKSQPQKVPPKRKNEHVRSSTANVEFEFKLTPTVEYSRKYGNHLYFGTLDEYGNFKPSITVKPIDVSQSVPKVDEKYIPLMTHVKQKEVYEFRFRTLIPGTIQNGEFIPDLGGGKIIDFADYKYSKDAKPIYNLPGKFFPIPKEK
jgi:hypothetical protein